MHSTGTLFTVGHAMLLVSTELRHEYPFPSVADAISLSMYPLILGGLMLQPRSSVRPDRSGVVDGLVLATGVCLVVWLFVVRPHVEHAGLTVLQRLTAIAYPAGDLLILGTAIVLFATARSAPSSRLMAVGCSALLVADVLFGLSRLLDNPDLLPLAWVGWIVFAVTWGGSVLHPSMATATEPRTTAEARFDWRRMSVLAVAAFIAPVALLVEAMTGSVRDAVGIAVLWSIILALVLVRLGGVVARHRDSVQRERGLREAGAALLSATDVRAVRAALDATVNRLLPADKPHYLHLFLTDEPAHPPAVGPGPPRFLRTAELGAPDGRRPGAAEPDSGAFDIALVSPLVIADRTSGAPHVGTLVLAADDATLRALEPTMQVLATQAALAIERITLSNEIARRNSEEYFRALVRNTADVILVVNDDNSIRYASPSAESMFGDRPLLGRPILTVLPPDRQDPARRLLDAVRSAPTVKGAVAELASSWSVLGAAGELEVESAARDLRADPAIAGLVITLRDVTEARRLERELNRRAYHDALTGLPNRLFFTELAQQAVARTRRGGTVVGVLLVDLDDFKIVNESMGYESGDQILIAVGQRLREMFTGHDRCARLGADEFAILIEDATDAITIEEAADRVVRALAGPVTVPDGVLTTKASVGVATTIDATNGGDLLRQADLALYLAKDAGKGCWRRYQAALHTAMVERLALRSALDRAVAAGDFILQYQPIVSLDDGSTIGFEALVRWQHATRGLIPPAEFIGLAEDSGLIVPMGGWILSRSMADAAAWTDSPGHGPYVSVNVSVRQFRTPGFVDKVRQELANSGLPAHRLVLEITESLLLRDDEQVWLDLAALRRLGIQVAIDDFGTGYSSLSYLRQVPVDVIKIDKSFVDTLGSSAQQRALVEGIIRLAQTLGLRVIAEGIERTTERDILVGIGCPLGQGFLYSRPMNADQIHPWLQAGSRAMAG